MIKASILADSINPAGVRLTSWLLTYPRFIHSELMTHRVFSRNSASSRAIPLAKMMQAVVDNPAMPEKWGAEQKGMQSGDEIEPSLKKRAIMEWLHDRNGAVECAAELAGLGIHKSIANRLIEPFAHMTAIFTATDHNNFFALRAHRAAQPEFQVLAYLMLRQYLANVPARIEWGGWHIPHFPNEVGVAWDTGLHNPETALKIATARCARLSYLTQDGTHDPAKDIELHDRLLASGHLSPFEHCAQAIEITHFDDEHRLKYMSNFDGEGQWSGWKQYRKQFENESGTVQDLDAIHATEPEWVKAILEK